MNQHYFKILVLLLIISLQPINSEAMNEADVPQNKRTKLGQYFSSTEASQFMQQSGRFALFIDVRDPHELQTTGMADPVDYNVPYEFINIKKWDTEKDRYQFETNPDFVKDVKNRFKAKGLSGFDAIVVICAAGTRAAKAVNTLADAGFKNVHTVVDGYNGWKYNELKWSKKLGRSRMYGDIALAR